MNILRLPKRLIMGLFRRWVMVESSDKMCSTGENGKPLQHSCLEKPMNGMKRQKDMTLKDELFHEPMKDEPIGC